MYFSKKAMTLIELLVVMSIMMVLAAMIVAGVSSAKKSARRAQCLSNMRAVGQAALLYAQSEGISGAFPYSNAADDRAGAMALLYNPIDFNDLEVFICPLQRKKDMAPPNETTHLFEAEHGANVSYWFVADSTGTTGQTLSFPMNNVLIIEEPAANGKYIEGTNHGTHGGSAFYINGKCKVIGKYAQDLPKNRNKGNTADYDIAANIYR